MPRDYWFKVTWLNVILYKPLLYLQGSITKIEDNGFGGSEPLLQVNVPIPGIVRVFGKLNMTSLKSQRNGIIKCTFLSFVPEMVH